MDKYYVYRPLLDLIGYTEGTDKGRGYNETLAYGKLLDGMKTKGKGPVVELVKMTLKELLALQTKMLKDPDNKWNSSALGRYQIVSKTIRAIRAALESRYPLTRLYDEDCQDEMACYLLGVRGIDKYLAGRMKEDTLINNLAKEWASFPTTQDKGHYAGQHTPIKAARVREVLAEVRRRHKEGQPKAQVVPPKAEKEIRETSGWGFGGTSLLGLLSGLGTWLLDADIQLVLTIVVGALIFGGVFILTGEYIIRRLRKITKALNDDVA
jgi:muramidase (phage lysozyme)